MKSGHPNENQYDPRLKNEPSMSAPSPMPGKNYGAQQGWSNPQQPAYGGYNRPQGYQPPPSQGIPGGQLPQQQYGAWQQGYTPTPQQGWSQPYQPVGRGWSQQYPAQEQPQQGAWQGGYTVNQWSEPQPQEQYIPGMPGGGSNSGGRPPMSRSTLIKLIVAAAVLVLGLTLVLSLVYKQNQSRALQEAVEAYSSLYCQGVYVDGIHLGGMTREEARYAVQKSAQLKCDEWNVSLVTSAGEYVGEINSYHLGMTVHVDDALNEAWQQGHTGATYAERKAAMDALAEDPFHTSTALPSGDNEAVDRILYELADKMYIPAVDASAVFDPTVNLASPFTITQEVVGRYLDIQSIKAQVYDMVSRMESGTITIEATPLHPAVTAEDIMRQTTLIGSYYTKISTTSTPSRDLNIKRAAELINGTVIEPGKTFSFNNVVGPRTKKNGFEIATVYSYGKEEEGYGGGVCQVSSTMYVAAIRANLEIVTRRQHGLVVGYTDLGLDATVNYDGKKIDFVFRNNTNSNLYIITKVMKKPYVDKNHYLVICDIYGPALETGVSYDLVAEQVEVPIPEATTVPDKKAEYVIYTDDLPYTIPGRIGYEVDSYKVKYVDGAEVERTHMYHDSYAPVQPIIYTGVSERPLEEWIVE